MNILFIGDIVGKGGRAIVNYMIEQIVDEYEIDFIIANGENASHGKGITRNHLEELFDDGIDVITLGNHYAAKKEIFNFIEEYDGLLRPSNLHHSIPGIGTMIFKVDDIKIRVTNLIGRVYMDQSANNPFDELQSIIVDDNGESDIHIVDFHAEATGEKQALAWAFDGKVDAILGTHTHVQTRDYRILPNGTAFISDVGMCGPYNGILGSKKEQVITKTWTGMPQLFEIEDDDTFIFSGCILSFNEKNKVTDIQPIYEILRKDEV